MIHVLEGSGLHRLAPFDPVVDGRLIYVTADLLKVLSDASDTPAGWRHIEARAFLDSFSLGGHFSV